MKKIQLILSLAVCALLSQNVDAALLRLSQFVGYGTGNLGADATTGTLDGWQNSTASVTVTNGSGSLTGTNLGLVASAGDKVFISTNTALNARNFFIVTNGTFPQSVETNLYFSFLYKFKNAGDVSTDGEIVMRLNRANSGTGTAQHWDLLAKNVAGQIQLGLFKAGGNVTNYAPANISIGQTFFAVVRQHIITGIQNDIYDLWINPPPESFGTNEANIPPSNVTTGTNTTDGAEDQSTTGPGRLVVAAGVNAEFDELRVAGTWAEATPWFGQCVPAGIAVSPASVTNSAEIASTFQVFEFGTSATFQWQVSTDGGTTFSNIAGATAATYTTPNLAMGDNGNKYRAIVNVDCNGSSATSGVASVTLIAPVATPISTIMDDTFTDPGLGFDDRANPPLTSSNSLWYTAGTATDNLTAQSGSLAGVPLAGGSSLWLGYFLATNQLPAHLAVGTSIRVTLPFTPVSFNSHTNNAGLRLGLFDYYDGGTRIIADGPNAGGSLGNGAGVRGYMLNVDFGTNFSANSPLQLLARNFLPDNNLMGTTSDYESLGSGPAGGGYSNAPAFQAGVEYTLEFVVTRTDVNQIVLNTTITGGGTNWSHSVVDNNYAYHRFDAFAIRPNSLETSADSFTFPEYIVEVVSGIPVPFPEFDITKVETLSPNSLILTWDTVNGATYYVLSQDTLTSELTTNATVIATGTSASYTNSPLTGTQRYFRIVAPPFSL